MPVRSERLTTVAGLMLISAAVWSGWLAWRDSEAKHRAAAQDRAIMHAEVRSAARERADMERRAARLEKNDLEFREYATKAHGETHRLLREVIRRLDDPNTEAKPKP